MSAELIIRRTLRDSDDASGQTLRAWTLTLEAPFLTLSGGVHPDAYSPVSIRAADAEILIADIRRLIGGVSEASPQGDSQANVTNQNPSLPKAPL